VPVPTPSHAAIAYLKRLVHRAAAIVLTGDKDYLVTTRLAPIVEEEGLPTFEALVAKLDATGPGVTRLRQKVVDAMTTNETSFFRDGHPFETLRNKILPAIAAEPPADRTLSIWSAACSTGQEIYSIAMVLQSLAQRFAGWSINLVATDISAPVVERAKEGRYSDLEVSRGVSETDLKRWFRRVGTEWQVRDELKRDVTFRTLNLIDPWPALPTFDIVFLRNVLIYFEVETKKKILGRIAGTMRPGGLLFLGGVESTLNLSDRFAEVQLGRSTCFRRLPGGA